MAGFMLLLSMILKWSMKYEREQLSVDQVLTMGQSAEVVTVWTTT